MIEKVRVSLWDIFTFFMTGLLAGLVTLAFLICGGANDISQVATLISTVPPSVALIAAPLVMTLAGMLIEPIANYADRYFLKYVLGWITTPKGGPVAAEEKLLESEIKEKYLGDLGERISRPYQICKDYVEYKQLSTTFMVFLARYGFYRNCSFIALVSGVAAVHSSSDLAGGFSIGLVCFLLAIIFRRRAEEFYSYQPGAIYRAFLIDKVEWKSKKGTQ
jgi:hypothetical protein